jgi:hypothetical protein
MEAIKKQAWLRAFSMVGALTLFPASNNKGISGLPIGLAAYPGADRALSGARRNSIFDFAATQISEMRIARWLRAKSSSEGRAGGRIWLDVTCPHRACIRTSQTEARKLNSYQQSAKNPRCNPFRIYK